MENPYASPTEKRRFRSFIRGLEDAGRRPKTILSYYFDWKTFSRWFEEANGEPFDLQRLSAIDVQDYKSFLLIRGMSNATINRRIVFLKRYARFGLEQGFLRQNNWRGIQQVQGLRRQVLAPRSLRSRDVRRFLKEVELRGSPRDQAIVYILLYTGLRVGELVNLRREDVTLSEKKGTIRLRGAVTKGGAERSVPVPLEARRRLAAYLESRGDEYSALFVGQRGPLREDAVVRVIAKYARWAGLKITPHLLRHTFAYQYLEKNANDLVGLAAILGHENLNTTRLYTQKRLEDLQEGVERVAYF